MLRGLTTVSFFADDVQAAAKWYTQVLGVEPYFARDVAGAMATFRRPSNGCSPSGPARISG
jgi:hypothetical protein